MSAGFESLISAYAAKQRWFAGHHAERVEIVDRETIRAEVPTLDWVLADIDGSHYQLVIGGRPAGAYPDFLAGHDHSVLGEADGMLWYDAVLDGELGLMLLRVFTGGDEFAERVRPIGVEQSNTSLVYDDRLIGMLFRRLHLGPNLDVEVTNPPAEPCACTATTTSAKPCAPTTVGSSSTSKGSRPVRWRSVSAPRRRSRT